MLKVKVFSDYPYSIAFGGKEIQLQQYIDYLSSKCDISVLNYCEKDDLEGVHILHLFGHSSTFLNIVKHVKVKYPRLKIVVSPTFYTDKFFQYKIASIFGLNLPFSNIFRDLSVMSNLVDLVMVNSEPEKEQFQSFFTCDENKLVVVFNGIESHFSKYCSGVIDCKIKRIIKEDYILSVGFFDERKNTNNLIKAFLNSKLSQNSKLVLVGAPRFSTSKHLAEFERIVNHNTDKIFIAGLLDRNSTDLSELYKNCKFHVLVSKLETPGLSNIEALMYGKNILVGMCPPVKSYFDSYAFYCDPNSLTSITQAINYMDIANLHTTEFLKKFAKDNFSLLSISQDIFSHYQELISHDEKF